MLSYLVTATTSYFKPLVLPITPQNLALRPSDELHVPTFETPIPNPLASKHTIIDAVLRENNLYSILGLPLYTSSTISLRHAYLSRGRACHPDKFPGFPPATLAFQKVSVAYNVLSSSSSRHAYDTRLRTRSPVASSDTDAEAENLFSVCSAKDPHGTFDGVLAAIFADFMDGDFQMIRMFLKALNEINPSLNVGEESIESLITSFRSLRELILVSQTYARLIHLHLLHLLEIQHAFRQLPYLDVCGRLRLTLQLARVTLEMPVAVDRALCERQEERSRELNGANNSATRHIKTPSKGGILPAKLCTIICCLVVVLEQSERVLQ